jgi:hypothetical protein
MEVKTMLKKLVFATLLCFCFVGVSSAQSGKADKARPEPEYKMRYVDPPSTRELRQREGATRLFEAERKLQEARTKEANADRALTKANPDGPQADRLARNAVEASKERAKAELTRDLLERRAREDGVIREARLRERPDRQ